MEIVDETHDEPVEFRFDTAGPGFSAWAGDRQIVAVSGREDRRAFAVNVSDGGRCSRTLADGVLAHLERVAAGDAVFDSPSPVLRDQARRRGWSGPLRRPLARATGAVVGSPAPAGAESLDHTALAAAVSELVGRPVGIELPSGSRRWFDFARLGYSAAVRLIVESPALTVAVPDRHDVMIEAVAGAIDTVVTVRDRFAPHADHLRVVWFDRATHTSQPSRWVGKANDTVFTIHLDDTLVLADEWARARRGGDGSWAPHPFTVVDAVTAHEAWHQIEFKFRGRRADLATFRRRLGAALGVETLEQAIQGGHRRAPEAFRQAHDRLRDTVSAYATTNPMEATAEMFELWWCGVTNPTIDSFGELMDHFFGATRP